MNREILLEEIQRIGNFQFSRSGGPGGQNVNKVNSRVQLKVGISEMDSLDEKQKNRLRSKLQNRLTTEDYLMISVEDTRDQHRNRELAVERLTDEIIKGLKRPKKRKPTRPTKASKERKKKQKQRRKTVKKLRKAPKPE